MYLFSLKNLVEILYVSEIDMMELKIHIAVTIPDIAESLAGSRAYRCGQNPKSMYLRYIR